MKLEKLTSESLLKYIGFVMLITAIVVMVIDVKIKNEVVRAANQAHADLEKMKVLGGIIREETAPVGNGTFSDPGEHSSNGNGLLANRDAGVEKSASTAKGSRVAKQRATVKRDSECEADPCGPLGYSGVSGESEQLGS